MLPQSAACTYRIAIGPRAGHKAFTPGNAPFANTAYSHRPPTIKLQATRRRAALPASTIGWSGQEMLDAARAAIHFFGLGRGAPEIHARALTRADCL